MGNSSAEQENHRQVQVGSLKDLGEQFQVAWKALFEAPSVGLLRPTQLSRTWKLEQTLCTRLFQALSESDPTSSLPKLPAATSLRSVLGRALKYDAPSGLLEGATAALEKLEQAIQQAGGSKSNLDILCARHQTHSREKIERKAKQQAFRGMASLLGVNAKVSFVQVYLYPSEEAGWCNELVVHGFLSLRRLRPELPVLLGAREYVPVGGYQGEVVMRTMLDQEINSDGLLTAVVPFCSKPMPGISLRQERGRLLYVLEGSKNDLVEEVDLCFASVMLRGEPTHATEDHKRARFTFIPNLPSEEAVFDLYVHQDLLKGQSPECIVLKTGDPTSLDLSAHSLDRLDLVENIEDLGSESTNFAIQSAPRNLELVEELHGRMGWEMGDFRLHRMSIRHPVMSFWYSMQFDLPSKKRP